MRVHIFAKAKRCLAKKTLWVTIVSILKIIFYILYKSGVKNITEFFPNLFKDDLTTEAATGGVL